LYSSSTMAAGSICSMASSKYPSNEGRKSLSFDLLASRLLGHRFHSFVSSALLTCSRSVYFPQPNVFKTHHDANNLLQLLLQNTEKWWIHHDMYRIIHQIIFKTYTTAIQYQKTYPGYRWWWKLVCTVSKLMCHKYM